MSLCANALETGKDRGQMAAAQVSEYGGRSTQGFVIHLSFLPLEQ